MGMTVAVCILTVIVAKETKSTTKDLINKVRKK